MNDTGKELKRLREADRVFAHLGDTLARADLVLDVLLGGDVDAVPQLNRNDPAGPTDAEQAATWWADVLDRTARRALELHRIGDGPGPAAIARACRSFAAALRVAAAGSWPQNLDVIEAEFAEALAAAHRDARQTAKGVLRGHELDQAGRRAAGPAGERLAGRIEHEARHVLAELRRLAGSAGQ
jgi:hypothetical protein